MLSKMKTVTTYFTNIIAACNQATVAGLDWDVDADQNQGIGFRAYKNRNANNTRKAIECLIPKCSINHTNLITQFFLSAFSNQF